MDVLDSNPPIHRPHLIGWFGTLTFINFWLIPLTMIVPETYQEIWTDLLGKDRLPNPTKFIFQWALQATCLASLVSILGLIAAGYLRCRSGPLTAICHTVFCFDPTFGALLVRALFGPLVCSTGGLGS